MKDSISVFKNIQAKFLRSVSNNKMQKILTINDIKIYSRKQVVAWVQSTNTYNFQDLRNGLFFIKILRKLVPNDIIKYKICDKPLNQYEQTQNMNIVKKVLNKHNLQLNMNVQTIVASKNCFELANWFRNLYQQNKNDNDTQFHYSEKSFTPSKSQHKFNEQNKLIEQLSNFKNSNFNFKSYSRATSSDKKNNYNNNNLNNKKLGRVTSGFVGLRKHDELSYTVKINNVGFESDLTYQLYSTNLNGQKKSLSKRKTTQDVRSAKSKGKNLSSLPMMNATAHLREKTMGMENERKKTKQNEKKDQESKLLTLQTFLGEEEEIIRLMKIESLEQQIGKFEEALSNIKSYLTGSQPDQKKRNMLSVGEWEEQTPIQQMKTAILSLIYGVKAKDTMNF